MVGDRGQCRHGGGGRGFRAARARHLEAGREVGAAERAGLLQRRQLARHAVVGVHRHAAHHPPAPPPFLVSPSPPASEAFGYRWLDRSPITKNNRNKRASAAAFIPEHARRGAAAPATSQQQQLVTPMRRRVPCGVRRDLGRWLTYAGATRIASPSPVCGGVGWAHRITWRVPPRHCRVGHSNAGPHLRHGMDDVTV